MTVPETTLEEEMGHWHIWEAAWKVDRIMEMLTRGRLSPRTICEVGSGSGDILQLLQRRLSPQCIFQGYDISYHAIGYSRQKENDRLHFRQADVRKEPEAHYDLMLVMDVLEHIEDCLGFLRDIRSKARDKIFQVSLNISVQTVLRKQGLPRIRDVFGMRNLFTKETLLQALEDADYEIVDWFYTIPSVEIPSHELPRKIMKFPRKAMFALSQDIAARVLGGCRILVLAR